MMRKQNKGSDFLPMQTRKNSELSIILTSLIFHCELATINFCPPRSSTASGWFCGGNSAETRWTENPPRWELEWGIREVRGGLKNQPHRFGGILKNHLSCTVHEKQTNKMTEDQMSRRAVVSFRQKNVHVSTG